MNITLFGGAFNPPHIGHLIVIQQAFELIPDIDELWILPCYRHTFLKNLVPAHHRLRMCELLTHELDRYQLIRAGSGNKFENASRTRQLAWQADKKNKTLRTVSFEADRISVARARALSIKPRVRICPIEIDLKLSGETYEALQKLRSEKAYLQQAMNHLDHDSSFIRHYSFLMGTDQLKDFKKWGSWEKLLEEIPFYIYPRSGYANHITFPNMTLLESPTQVVTNISSTLIRERIQNSQQIAHLLPASVLKYLRVNKLY